MKVTKRDEFLRATDNEGWRTLEEIVQALDRADYWGKEPHHEAEKRRHVREMIATLRFGEDAPRLNDGLGVFSLVGEHMFVSIFRADESGALVRVYKQFMKLTFDELGEVGEQVDSEQIIQDTYVRRVDLDPVPTHYERCQHCVDLRHVHKACQPFTPAPVACPRNVHRQRLRENSLYDEEKHRTPEPLFAKGKLGQRQPVVARVHKHHT